MNLDASIPLGETGTREVGDTLGNMMAQRTARNDMAAITNIFKTSPDPDTAIRRIKQVNYAIGSKMEAEKLKLDADKQAFQQKVDTFRETHKMTLLQNKFSERSHAAAILEGMDMDTLKPEDWRMAAETIAMYGIQVPAKPDPIWRRQFIDETKGLEGRLNEMKAAKTGSQGGQWIQRSADWDKISAMPQGPEREKAELDYLYKWVPGTGYGASPGAVDQAGAKAGAQARAKIGPSLTLAQGKADIELEQKRKEAALQEVSGQQLKKDDISLMSGTIAEIEANPTVLEKLPAGYVDIARNAGKFGLTTEAATMYANNLQRISDIAALMARSKLKGQGQVSDFEGKMLASASTNIKTGTPAQRKAELARIKDMTEKMAYRIENGLFTKNGKWYKFAGTTEVEVSSDEMNKKISLSKDAGEWNASKEARYMELKRKQEAGNLR